MSEQELSKIMRETRIHVPVTPAQKEWLREEAKRRSELEGYVSVSQVVRSLIVRAMQEKRR
jgi:hypothetical protein